MERIINLCKGYLKVMIAVAAVILSIVMIRQPTAVGLILIINLAVTFLLLLEK